MAISKSAKIQAEIEKVTAKINEQQARLKELEQKKLEAENSEIVDDTPVEVDDTVSGADDGADDYEDGLTADGITIDDCERVHRAIDPVIDEHDPIENSYHLEVSSPGIERVLRTEEHIEAFAGEEVEAKLFAPLDGKKTLRGILGGIEDGKVILTVGDTEYRIEHAKISRLTTVFDF